MNELLSQIQNKTSYTLNIRVKVETLEQIDRLKKRLGAPSRSDIIRRAVELNDYLAEAIEHGDKIIIEGKKGIREITLPGLKSAR